MNEKDVIRMKLKKWKGMTGVRGKWLVVGELVWLVTLSKGELI